jgi:hypothetical protein
VEEVAPVDSVGLGMEGGQSPSEETTESVSEEDVGGVGENFGQQESKSAETVVNNNMSGAVREVFEGKNETSFEEDDDDEFNLEPLDLAKSLELKIDKTSEEMGKAKLEENKEEKREVEDKFAEQQNDEEETEVLDEFPILSDEEMRALQERERELSEEVKEEQEAVGGGDEVVDDDKSERDESETKSIAKLQLDNKPEIFELDEHGVATGEDRKEEEGLVEEQANESEQEGARDEGEELTKQEEEQQEGEPMAQEAQENESEGDRERISEEENKSGGLNDEVMEIASPYEKIMSEKELQGKRFSKLNQLIEIDRLLLMKAKEQSENLAFLKEKMGMDDEQLAKLDEWVWREDLLQKVA